jgi:hypothetical protein
MELEQHDPDDDLVVERARQRDLAHIRPERSQVRADIAEILEQADAKPGDATFDPLREILPGASTSSRSAQSRTRRASGPTTSRLSARGNTPSIGTRPNVGRTPTMPLQAAGTRIEPLVSVPSAASAIPDATATAEPLDEPPGECACDQALRTSPKRMFWPEVPAANSFRLVLPSITAPAAASRSTTTASEAGMRFSKWASLRCVRTPAVSMLSLQAYGMPCSGPRSRPAASSDQGPPLR